MVPIVAGVMTALFFATSALSSARASRRAASAPAVAGLMIVGAIVLAPIALFVTPMPDATTMTGEPFLFASMAGAFNIAGLLLIYGALRIGAVGVVSTIASTEGAIAAILSVMAGQMLAPESGPALALIALGVVLAAAGGGQEIEEGAPIGPARSVRAAGLAAAAALMFGCGLFTIGHASATLPPTWIVWIGRLIGVAFIGLPLFVTGRLRIPRAALPYVILTGLSETAGYSLYALGASHDIAVTAILGSMFAPTAAAAAFILFRERLARHQIAGIALVVIGIAALAVVTT